MSESNVKLDVNELLFTGRGSSALWVMLKSLGKPNGKVLLPVNICEIVYPLVTNAGYEPVFYDVNYPNGNASLDNIKDAYKGDEEILIAVHNFGAPLEIDNILKWAKERNIVLIEDVCNAIGAQYEGRPVGTFGDAAFFSFGYAKIIEYGVGGAILVKDRNLKFKVSKAISCMEEFDEYHRNIDAEYQLKLRKIRQKKYDNLTSVYVPLYKEYSNHLLYKISHKMEQEIKRLIRGLDKNIKERGRKALRYRTEIQTDKVKHIDEVKGQVYWRYNLLVAPEIRQKLVEKLRDNDILVSMWYPPIVDLFEQNTDTTMYSNSRRFSEQIINLFVDQRVSDADISETTNIINTF